jgi:8-oxo-dGTP pyrophosphatase MutT (NUDIX family)
MFRIATTAIIFNREGKMLITKRADHKKQWPGKWTVPGGGLETDDFTSLQPSHQGDTDQWYGVVANATRREVLEETGLQVHRLWLVTDLAFIRADNIPVLVLSWAGDLVGDPDLVVYDEDTVDHAWVDLAEASHYDLIDGIYSELEMAALEWGRRLVA